MFVQMESQTGEHSALLQTRRGWMTSTWEGGGQTSLVTLPCTARVHAVDY